MQQHFVAKGGRSGKNQWPNNLETHLQKMTKKGECSTNVARQTEGAWGRIPLVLWIVSWRSRRGGGAQLRVLVFSLNSNVRNVFVYFQPFVYVIPLNSLQFKNFALLRIFITMSPGYFVDGMWTILIFLIFISYCTCLRWMAKCLVLEWNIGSLGILM
jgi:hypothetical protein